MDFRKEVERSMILHEMEVCEKIVERLRSLEAGYSDRAPTNHDAMVALSTLLDVEIMIKEMEYITIKQLE